MRSIRRWSKILQCTKQGLTFGFLLHHAATAHGHSLDHLWKVDVAVSVLIKQVEEVFNNIELGMRRDGNREK